MWIIRSRPSLERRLRPGMVDSAGTQVSSRRAGAYRRPGSAFLGQSEGATTVPPTLSACRRIVIRPWTTLARRVIGPPRRR